jgi:hypothetical protein
MTSAVLNYEKVTRGHGEMRERNGFKFRGILLDLRKFAGDSTNLSSDNTNASEKISSQPSTFSSAIRFVKHFIVYL